MTTEEHARRTVADGLRRYADAGATEVVLTAHQDLDPAVQSRTRGLAGALARAAAPDHAVGSKTPTAS